MLLTARRIVLIHFLMRLPDMLRPAIHAADRFVQRFVKLKLIGAIGSCAALAVRSTAARPFGHQARVRMVHGLPRSTTQEGSAHLFA